jgi:serine/threonine-protein kinase
VADCYPTTPDTQTDEQLLNLLVDWLAALERGETLTPEQLTHDCPGLLARLRHEIQLRQRTMRVLQPPRSNPTHIPMPTVPGYELFDEPGRGGMGIVYRARHVQLNRLVAVKFILDGAHPTAEQTARFLTEAAAAAQVTHPNVVAIYDIDTLDDKPFFSCEYCPGGTLARRIQPDPQVPAQPLNARMAVQMLLAVAAGVHAAHLKGIIHRDLKPSNILFDAVDQPKVCDFGLAKLAESELTLTGTVMGTPSYMAPEQAAGHTKAICPATDVWALGTILYECLTAQPAFRGASPYATVNLVQEAEPVRIRALNPTVPLDLETICLQCLQKDPARRYPTMPALSADLQRFLEGKPVAARPVGWVEQSWRWCRRHRAIAGLMAACVVLLLGGTITSTVLYFHAEARATEAKANEKLALQRRDQAREAVLLYAPAAERVFSRADLTEAERK